MGTNYYLVSKKDFEDTTKINEQLSKSVNLNTLRENIKKQILDSYSAVIEETNKRGHSILNEKFNENVENALDKLMLVFKYDAISDFNTIEQKHIGKSSAGWLFCFQYQDEWHSYNEFKNYILNKENMKDKLIIDEYDNIIEPKEMIEMIDKKQNDALNKANPDNFKYNDNVDGYSFSSEDFS